MRLIACLLISLFMAVQARSQSVDATRMGEPVNLAGNWLYHSGDDLRWAAPELNDSGWTTISTNKDWYAGGTQWRGYYWYRLHIKLPPETRGDLKLLFNYTGNPFEVFANGVRVGGYGEFPPHLKIMRMLVRAFPIPHTALKGDQLTIAVRFFTPSILNQGWGGLRSDTPVLLGPADAIDTKYAARIDEIFHNWIPDLLVRFFSVLLALALLTLYWLDREHEEYVWIAGYAFAMTAYTALMDYQNVAPLQLMARSFFDLLLNDIAMVLLIQFVFVFLQQVMPLWLRIYQISLLFHCFLVLLAFQGWSWASDAVWNVILLAWLLPFTFLLPGLVLWRYLRGNKEAGLLVVPLFLINFNDMLSPLGYVLFAIGVRKTPDPMIPPFHLGFIPVYVGEVEGLLFMVSIAGILLYRYHQTTREQARTHAELEAARSMQDVMLARQIRTAPGFSIDSAYIPAQEVGGDFFQVFPGRDGTLLVVIGDVSGKGLKAAMLVSLILGLLQKTVEDTRDPAQVLQTLNRLLVGQTDGRFATCCCALLQPNGEVLAANAGHLSPYNDGTEIDIPGGLPLGMAEGIEYEQVRFRVTPGKRIVFLSDGVIEARSKSGELYGFERTETISQRPVQEIADIAREFGQEDDITVLGIEPAMA